MRFVATESAPKAIGPYSQGTISGGFLYTAGQITLEPATMQVTAEGITEQTRQVMTNLSAILAAAGTSLERVVKSTVFLTDMGDFAAMNEGSARAFGARGPGRSTVALAGLQEGVRVESEVVAAAGG